MKLCQKTGKDREYWIDKRINVFTGKNHYALRSRDERGVERSSPYIEKLSEIAHKFNKVGE